MECHGIPWNAMDVMLFPWHFSGILWHPGGMPWNSMECHGRYIISMTFQLNSMTSRWNAMEFHGMPWTLYYFHGISVELYGIQVECHEMQ